MKMFTQNSKTKKTGQKHDAKFVNFGLPAIKTCPYAAECRQYCYACKGNYKRFPNVVRALESKLDLYNQDRAAFYDALRAELTKLSKSKKPVYIRLHDTGDFFNYMYAKGWFDLMREFPNIRFYAYTKSFAILPADRPENFTCILSYGGVMDGYINQETDRHARIFKTKEELEAAGYVDGSDDDMVAADPSIKNVGLVAH